MSLAPVDGQRNTGKLGHGVGSSASPPATLWRNVSWNGKIWNKKI
jgi:hypothetical protein